MNDQLIIGGTMLQNRLFLGTGKFSSNKLMEEVIKHSGVQVVMRSVVNSGHQTFHAASRFS